MLAPTLKLRPVVRQTHGETPAVLTDEEMALGVEGWRLLVDPFGPWYEEAVA